MRETTDVPSAYSYQAITAVTEKRLNEFLEQARAAPENTETLLSYFSATFQLWFEITQQDPTPQQDKDGPRFLDLIPQFPEPEEDQPDGSVNPDDDSDAAMRFEDARTALMMNAATPGDYASLTTWDALRAAADAELLQATYHMTQLEEVVRCADNVRTVTPTRFMGEAVEWKEIVNSLAAEKADDVL